MKILLLLLLFIGLINGQTEQKEKEKLVRKHIVNDQIEIMSKMFFDQQVELVKENYKAVPDSIWSQVKLHVDEQDRLLNETIKIYCDLFTLDELKEIDKAMSFPGMIKLNKFNSDGSYDQKFGQMGVKCGRDIMNEIEAYLNNLGFVK